MRHHYNTGRPELDQLIAEFLEKAGGSPEIDLLQEMITTVVRLRDEQVNRGELKIINTTLKELRYAFKVFAPYRGIRKVAIFGSARTPKNDPDYGQARQFCRAIAKRGWMVITGGATGIMSAGNEGAGRENSFGVNIRLPFEQEANPIIAKDPKLINFKYFFTRKLMFLKESDATVLSPGGFGTHDEGFESLTLVQTGKTAPRPIVCLDPRGSTYWKSWRRFLEKELLRHGMIDILDMDLLTFTHDIKEAVNELVGFYKNYHSLRFVGDDLVIRMHRPIGEKALLALNQDFKRLVRRGRIQQIATAFPEEENEPETLGLSRLVFTFNRRDFALLRKMIDVINQVQ